MNCEIIRSHGDLNREVWMFSLSVGWATNQVIYWDSYCLQARETTRKKWRTHTIWTRLNSRENTVNNPPLPDDIEREAHEYFANQVAMLEIRQ